MYSDRAIRFVSPGFCDRIPLDLDTATVGEKLEPTGYPPSFDLLYDGCDPSLSRRGTGSRATGFGTSGPLTPAGVPAGRRKQRAGHRRADRQHRQGRGDLRGD